ncbi:hypothetical protein J5N97_006195 [Dioscorea zingiberensis]|uniref:Uncharacterized protein n=1 Tax=Dioscorea zingiberensis TaxID=325984 RepID=A0A9D5DAH0_9LILI|nr:hypothetical protein J5N97_006195 [Dioscorea zingiberensis]
MEGNKKPTGSSIADELFGRKDSGRSSQSGLFSSIFPAPSSGVGRDALQSDLFGSSTSRSHATTDPGHSWSAQSTAPGSYGNSHGSPSKTHSMPHKDGYSGEALNTCNLSSSLYYGGQDICSNVSSVHGYGTQYTFEQKRNGEDDSDSSNMASRGNWWQGSLYY